MHVKHWNAQIIKTLAKSEPIVIFMIFKQVTSNSTGNFHLQRGHITYCHLLHSPKYLSSKTIEKFTY